jgi:predicted nucleotidyltransferase
MKIRGIKSFCRENGIVLLVLFGSCAGDKAGTARDIDVAVKFRKGIKVSKLQLIYKLDDFFKGKNIDIVSLTTDTDPLLLHEIFIYGKCLYERKKGIFENEKLRAWKLYLDTEKIRHRRSRYLKEFVKKVSYVA